MHLLNKSCIETGDGFRTCISPMTEIGVSSETVDSRDVHPIRTNDHSHTVKLVSDGFEFVEDPINISDALLGRGDVLPGLGWCKPVIPDLVDEPDWLAVDFQIGRIVGKPGKGIGNSPKQ